MCFKFYRMPPMDKALFEGSSEFRQSDAVQLEITDYEDSITRVLHNHKWNKQAIGCIVLELSTDNTKVENGCFVVRGPLDTHDIKLKASTLWATAADAHLVLKIPDGDEFSFEDGSLCSEYLSSEEVTHGFYKYTDSEPPTALLAGEVADLGFGPFCLRLVCHLVRATVKNGVYLHFTVLILPGTKDDIMEVSELAQSASWPGLMLTEGDLALFPLPPRAWQCPVLPMLLTGTPWDDDNFTLPPAQALRRAIAAIMVRSTPPEVYKTRAGMVRNWEKYANSPDEFTPKRSPVSWPAPEAAEPTTGRTVPIYSITFMLS